MISGPYVQKDLDVIIDAYTHPGKGHEITQDSIAPGTKSFQNLQSMGSGTGYSVAEMSNKLQSYIDMAKGAVETVYGYGTFNRQDARTEEIMGVEFNNTILTMTQAGNVWEAGATLLSDCIPCQDRILAMLSLNPVKDVWAALNAVYDMLASFVVSLFDFFLGDKSLGIFADICSLLQFLSFMCVPDLTAIILVLNNLIAKYTVELKDLKVTIQDLLGKLIGSSLAPLLAMLDKYIQLIVAPVDCVIGEVDHIIQRLAGADKQSIDPNKKTAESVAAPFMYLRKYLQDGSDAVKETIDKLNDDMAEMLKTEEGVNGHLFSLTGDTQKVAQLIGLVQALLMAVNSGGITCGQVPGEEELNNFINNYLAPTTDVDITAQDGTIRMRASVPSGLEGMKDLLHVVGTYKKEKEGKDLPSTSEKDRSTTGLIVEEITIPLKNCLYTIQDNELNAVKGFLSTFE